MNKTTQDKPLCFVIMPFEKVITSSNTKYKSLNRDDLDTIYGVLKIILQRAGYKVKRATAAGDILADIILDLDQANLVIADLTGLNPNVMYELGIRHGFTKPTIMLSQDVNELPFDLKSHHCIEYQWMNAKDQRKLGQDLRHTLKLIRENTDTRFGPVHSHLGSKRLALREKEFRDVLKKFGALIAEIKLFEGPLKAAYDRTLEHGKKEKTAAKQTKISPPSRTKSSTPNNYFFETAAKYFPSSFPAIDLLLTTRYLPDELNNKGQLNVFYSTLGTFRYFFATPKNWTSGLLYETYKRLLVLENDMLNIYRALVTGDIEKDLSLESVIERGRAEHN